MVCSGEQCTSRSSVCRAKGFGMVQGSRRFLGSRMNAFCSRVRCSCCSCLARCLLAMYCSMPCTFTGPCRRCPDGWAAVHRTALACRNQRVLLSVELGQGRGEATFGTGGGLRGFAGAKEHSASSARSRALRCCSSAARFLPRASARRCALSSWPWCETQGFIRALPSH